MYRYDLAELWLAGAAEWMESTAPAGPEDLPETEPPRPLADAAAALIGPIPPAELLAK